MADYEDNKQKSSFTLFNNETGKSYELPIIKGTDGPDVLDIRKLYQETGLFTYDPGFTSTASCDSAITFIDGNKGILRHRGYDIHELASKSEFLEVCYLLLHGDLPSPEDPANLTVEVDAFCSWSACNTKNLSIALEIIGLILNSSVGTENVI